jgi:hypothetical protein
VRLLVFPLRHPVRHPVHHVPVVLFAPWLALFGHDPTSLSASRSWSSSLTVRVSDIHRIGPRSLSSTAAAPVGVADDGSPGRREAAGRFSHSGIIAKERPRARGTKCGALDFAFRLG